MLRAWDAEIILHVLRLFIALQLRQSLQNLIFQRLFDLLSEKESEGEALNPHDFSIYL